MSYGNGFDRESDRQRNLAIEGALKREHSGYDPNVGTDFDGTGFKVLNYGKNKKPTDIVAATLYELKKNGGEVYTDAEILENKVPEKDIAGGHEQKWESHGKHAEIFQ